MIILHRDMAALKFCNRGGREFFARYGLDWADFMQNGIDSSLLVDIDDDMMRQVIAEAARRITEEGEMP